MQSKLILRAGAILVTLSLLGCSSTGGRAPSATTHAVHRIPGQDPATAMDAAEQAMVEQGYKIDRRDAVIGVLTSHPVELTGADAERGGRRLGTESNRRSVAEVRISRTGDAVNVFCKVVIEEQTTQTYRFFQQQYDADYGEETAIDRDAATTAKQNSVWSPVRRDRAAERAILAAVAERLGDGVETP